MDWNWTRSSIRSSLPSGKNNKHSSITSRTARWCDRILETERWSSEQMWVLSILVWWSMEEQDGRWRRQQQMIWILYWPSQDKKFLVLSSSSMSFRTQSHWSFTAAQCVKSEQFPRVHLSFQKCNQFTLHQEFRLDNGRTEIWQGKTDGSLYSRESMNKDHNDPQELDLHQTDVLHPPRPPGTISDKDNWMKALGFKSCWRWWTDSHDRIGAKARTQLWRAGRPVTRWSRSNPGTYQVWSRHSSSGATWWGHKFNELRCRPVCGSESTITFRVDT